MPIPVISIAQMRQWEKATWSTGQSETEVIQRVGKIIAQSVSQLLKPGASILILAGKGNNGEDARAAIPHLAGFHVEQLDVKSPETDSSKLEAALDKRPSLVIDGLFGIGLNRPLDESWKRFIARINQSQLPVFSVDVPSGLNAETGEAMGAAIEASITLTVGAPKQGMLKQSAWPFVGRLEVTPDVGLVPCPIKSELQWTLHDDFSDFPPRRNVAAHKGGFGHVAIIAGSAGYHGAAVLAARAAQRAQPGLITLFTHEPVYPVVASQLQAAMVSAWNTGTTIDEEYDALLVGPGLASATLQEELKTTVRRLWRDRPEPMIVDASALDWLPQGATPKDSIRVITPHPGEAARLLKVKVTEVQADRVGSLRELSKNYGNCWVVLKGHQTLVGRNSGDVFVNSSGNPYLAQGGSGDLLAGFISGLIAQPALQADVQKTVRYAVWQHGAAADELQSRRKNWVVEELANELGNCRK